MRRWKVYKDINEDFNNDVLKRAMDIVKRIKYRTSLGINSNMLLKKMEGWENENGRK